ncbi:uncharacterized protein JCM10292_003490 [Rhodotorula paludigena]|uniref:uncharacterized protein n=1 Tax=Rhodotorula paludigena TaxID=86838 RepID=UPI003172B40D
MSSNNETPSSPIQFQPGQVWGGLRKLVSLSELRTKLEQIEKALRRTGLHPVDGLDYLCTHIPEISPFVRHFENSYKVSEDAAVLAGARLSGKHLLLCAWTPPHADSKLLLDADDDCLTSDWVTPFAESIAITSGYRVWGWDLEFVAPPEQYLQERADAGKPGWSEETDDEESECYVKVLELVLKLSPVKFDALLICGSVPARRLGTCDLGEVDVQPWLHYNFKSVAVIDHPRRYLEEGYDSDSLSQSLLHLDLLALEAIPEDNRPAFAQFWQTFVWRSRKRVQYKLWSVEKAEKHFKSDLDDVFWNDKVFDTVITYKPRIRHNVQTCGRVSVVGESVNILAVAVRPGQPVTGIQGGKYWVAPEYCVMCGGKFARSDIHFVRSVPAGLIMRSQLEELQRAGCVM